MKKKEAIISNLPVYDDVERAWDSAEAIKRIKSWATSDGGVDFAKYRKAFFLVEEAGEKQSDYKLPFADIVDGELKAVWRGVSAAMASVVGTRGGIDLSDDEQKSVYEAIAPYYGEFNQEAPALKTIDPEEPTPNPTPAPAPEDLPIDKMAGALYMWKSGEEGDKPVYGLKAFYDAEEKIAIASTDVQDRQGERIDQGGWELKNFKNNPVMLWAHDHTTISVGNARNIHIERKNGSPRLVFTPDFHEATPEAKALKVLYDEGRMNSFSVGFIPKDFDAGTSTYTKQELLEISAVNVPANPEAMMSARKSLVSAGISKSVIEKVVPEEKGAIAQEITREETFEQKRIKMQNVWKVMYAFTDVFFDEKSGVDDFSPLLKEVIGLLGKVADGEDVGNGEEAETPIAEMLILGLDEGKVKEFADALEKVHMVVDKPTDAPESENNHDDTDPVKAQVTTPAAPNSEATVRAEQSLVKVIARASDHLLHGEKNGQTQAERVKMQKVIKRAAEILSKSQRSKLDNGKTR
jgi:HK97 family phage prohead protease